MKLLSLAFVGISLLLSSQSVFASWKSACDRVAGTIGWMDNNERHFCAVKSLMKDGNTRQYLTQVPYEVLTRLQSQCRANTYVMTDASTGGYQTGNTINVTAEVYTVVVCNSSLMLE